MPTIEMKTELPGPRSRAIIASKEQVVCDLYVVLADSALAERTT